MTNSFARLQLPPLSLYIHIPWCVKKCPYCDFNSHTADNIPESAYVDALKDDLNQERQYIQERKLHSIFFGGGTPSLFSPQAIASILNHAEKTIGFTKDIEITLEANPGTVEQKKFSGYHAAGINRLSIGVQSFNKKHLEKLGRVHDHHEAIKAAHSAQKAGIKNFNIDLMHGLPEQNQQQALADLQQAIDLGASHLSWYQLTIEPNTVFYSSPPRLPEDDQLADIQQAGELLLSDNNFNHYETSAFSQHSFRSAHNINYWEFGDYIGIGAGAHGKITDLTTQNILRRWKTRLPKDYLKPGNTRLAGEKIIGQQELPLEFFMNSLRLVDGFDISLFNERTGLDYSHIANAVSTLMERGLLNCDHNKMAPTELGKRFLNELLEAF